MSAENCPLKIFPKEISSEEAKRKDKYVSFDIPVDPNTPDGLKATHEFRRLDQTDAESVLSFIEKMDELIINLDIAEGSPRFRIIRTLLGGDAAKKWNTIAAGIAPQVADQTQPNFKACIEKFLLTYMDREISIDTKEWFQVLKKPKSMTVQGFLARLRELNDLIEYMPSTSSGPPALLTPKFTEAKLAVILRKACPKSWRDAQVKANMKGLDLNE